MKLPNGDRAELGDKLERYCLNPHHPKGQHKAAMFKSKLGISLENKEVLENALLRSAIEDEAELYKSDQYGDHYDVYFNLETDVGSSRVLGAWIVQSYEDVPRLTNSYPV